MKSLLFTPFLCLAALSTTSAAPSDYYRITVQDADTGHGVPLVELRGLSTGVRYVTDSSGIAAINDPELMGQSVFFKITSPGYEYPSDSFGYHGLALPVTADGSVVVKLKRLNIAERLYRITGAGIYRDSILTCQPVPIKQPLLNGKVFGQDMVTVVPYNGKLVWFFGDTNRPSRSDTQQGGRSSYAAFPTAFFGIVLAAAAGAAAYKAGALTRGGAVAAWGVGAIIFGVGGWPAAGALLTFFGTSTLLSRWRRVRKESLGYEKGGRRDAGQVLANGGVAAVCVLLTLAGVKNAMLLFLAALAAANADTWATEIGSALGGQPFDLRTGRKAAAGASGAVSLPGSAAALAGAALLGLFADGWAAGAIVTTAGFIGALFDSVLGAAVQAQWQDPENAGRWTERSQPGPPGRGWRWVNNDCVNLFCTLSAAGLAVVLLRICG